MIGAQNAFVGKIVKHEPWWMTLLILAVARLRNRNEKPHAYN